MSQSFTLTLVKSDKERTRAPQPEYTTFGCYDPKLRELAEMARSASAVAEDDEPKEN